MKKVVGILVAVGLIAAISVGAYAHGGWGNYGQGRGYGGHMMGGYGGHMMGGYGGPMMGGWNAGPGPMMGGWTDRGAYAPCPWFEQGTTPGETGVASQIISADKAKEVAESYVTQYLPGYTVDKVEQDSWRPMYSANLKGENGAELQLWIHGFSGQVMHLVPKPAEVEAEVE